MLEKSISTKTEKEEILSEEEARKRVALELGLNYDASQKEIDQNYDWYESLSDQERQKIDDDKKTIAQARQEIDGVFDQSKSSEVGGSVKRVVGKVSESEKEKIFQRQRDEFRGQESFKARKRQEWLPNKEKEKTQEELAIVSMVNDLTNKILRKYGLESFDVPPENIHITKTNFITKLLGFLSDSTVQGKFYNNQEAIEITDPAYRLGLAKTMLHEVIHFKSYNALQIRTDGNPIPSNYRLGVRVVSRDGENIYFKNLNEAITELLAKEYLEKIVGHPMFTQDVERYREDEMLHRAIGEGSYYNEIEVFNTLIDRLFERNKEAFGDRKEVFDVFAKAMMVGNILPIGRLIDNTFGSGVFRKIGELDSDIKEQKSFIDSL